MEIFYAHKIDGSLALLDADESAHCVKVLRHRAGDAITVVDGCGSMFRCRLADDSHKGATAEILETVPDWGGHSYSLNMAVCPTKNNDRFEWFAEKATSKAYLKVLKRGALIFLVGFALNLYPFFPTSVHDQTWTFGQNYLYWLQHKRIFGVLQRIGMAYAIAGCLALWLKKPGRILAAIGTICVAYTGILLIFGRDPGAFTLEGNVSMRIDTWLVGGDHCYHGFGGTNFDPEGVLGSLPAACSCLLGYLIGFMIHGSQKNMSALCQGSSHEGSMPSEAVNYSPDRVVNRTFIYGCLSLILGIVLSIWIPICKPLWSVSYVFYTGGWAMLTLAFLAYLLDVKGYEKPFVPFKAMGMNALMAFVFSGVIAKSYGFFGFAPARYFGANEYLSLLWSLIFASVIFAILWVLYKKKIVIKL